MTERSLHDLIQKFREGSITDEELRRLQSFLDRPDSRKVLQELDFSQLPVSDTGRVSDTDIMFRNIQERIRSRQDRRSIIRPWHWVAAASVMMVAIGTALLMQRRTSTAEAVQWVVMTTAPGENKKVVFPDHSIAYLNAGSRLRYLKDFSDTVRKVELEGGAFFEVAHMPEKPFIVHTSYTDTRVLGTRFNVEAYDEEKVTRIGLVDGKVMTGDRNHSLILQPGTVLVENNHTGDQTVKSLEVNTKDWIAGHLVLNDLPLQEAMKRISNFYGIPVSADSTIIKDYHITGSFEPGKPEKMLDVLVAVYDLKWKKIGSSYIVYSSR